MTREYKKWKNRSTNKNEQLLKIQHYIKVRLLKRDERPSIDCEGRASKYRARTAGKADLLYFP